MNRSHVAPLLIAVFALAILGMAASTLQSAHPVSNKQKTTVETPGKSHTGGQASQSQSQSGKRQGTHSLMPNLNVKNGLNSGQIRSGSTLTRLALGIGLLLFGALLVIWRLTTDDERGEIVDGEETGGVVTETKSSTPSMRVNDLPLTNNVYRAWRTMVRSLGPPRENQETPAELERRAIRAKLPEMPVHELTELFRSVRYGGKFPNDSRERRAQKALDEIRQSENMNDADSTTATSEK